MFNAASAAFFLGGRSRLPVDLKVGNEGLTGALCETLRYLMDRPENPPSRQTSEGRQRDIAGPNATGLPRAGVARLTTH